MYVMFIGKKYFAIISTFLKKSQKSTRLFFGKLLTKNCETSKGKNERTILKIKNMKTNAYRTFLKVS
jgi:hypothetical protein